MKRYFLIGSIVMFGLALAGFLTALLIPSHIQQQTALVDYSQNSSFTYLIYLKPSTLYGPTPQTAPPDQRYPLAAVASLDFIYTFSPAVKGPISGRAEVILENPGVWQKVVSLLPETAGVDGLSLSFSLDPAQMNQLFADIEAETAVPTSSRSLSIRVDMASGKESFSQSLPMTVSGNVLLISNDLIQSLPQGQGQFNYSVKQKSPAVVPAPAPAVTIPEELVDSLDFSYSYRSDLKVTPQASVSVILQNPGVWQKSLELVPRTALAGEAPLRFNLDIRALQAQFDTIDNETGLSSSTRLITLQISVIQGSQTLVQNLPLSIENKVLTIPGDLQSDQPSGSGVLKYVVNLEPSSLFGSRTYTPPAAAEVPAALASPSYTINLKPGPVPPVLPETILRADQTAFTRLIDKMDVTFSYRFQSNQAVDGLTNTLDIAAILEAPKYWSKTFPILHNNKNGNFDQTFGINLAEYFSNLQAISSETGTAIDTLTLTLSASVHTTGTTRFGPIDQTINPVLKGTIANGILTWDKNTSTNKAGSITTRSTVSNPRSYLRLSAQTAKTAALVAAVFFMLICVLLVVFYLRAKPLLISELEKEAQAIEKKYSARLVEALDQSPQQTERTISLKSMEDLIKVADELAKPVIYQSPGPGKTPRLYFILDGTTRYQYSLETA